MLTRRRFLQQTSLASAALVIGFRLDVRPAAAAEGLVAEFGAEWDSAPAELRELVVLNGAINTLLEGGNVSQDDVQQTLIGADVTVSPRYGRWEPEGGGVVPLG